MSAGPLQVLIIEDHEHDFQRLRVLFDQLNVEPCQLEHLAMDAASERAPKHYDLYLIADDTHTHAGIGLVVRFIAQGCVAPIVVLADKTEPLAATRALEAGAFDFLIKEQMTSADLERALRYAQQQRTRNEAHRQAQAQVDLRVSERTAALEKMNQALQQEVQERARLEEKMREMNRKKDLFLATLAHELRSPLAPLMNAVQLLQMVPENANQVRDLAAMMSRQASQLVRLIDDLLDVSRISAGKLQINKQRLRLGEPVAAALHQCRKLIEETCHMLHVSITKEPLELEGDPVRLTQVFTNLLSNAAKFTPHGGSITLTVERQGHQAMVAIRDSGIGIPKDRQQDVFNMFEQIDSSNTRQQSGLGIGLTLAKTLVEMHGGTIQVSSEGENQGSEFRVLLPLAVNAGAAVPKEDSLTPEAAGKIPGYRVLVVDDNEAAAKMLSRLLEQLGQQVKTAQSTQAALNAMNEFRPELVISDVAMPGSSGLELASQLRSRRDIKQPLLVALTGYGSEQDRRDVFAAGFDQHIVKPIGLPALQQLLSHVDG